MDSPQVQKELDSSNEATITVLAERKDANARCLSGSSEMGRPSSFFREAVRTAKGIGMP